MARLGMVDFMLLSRSIKSLDESLHDAQEKSALKVMVDPKHLERVLKTLKGFDVQILNSRGVTP